MSACPNCNRPLAEDFPAQHCVEDACVLGALFGVVRDRGTLTDEQIAEMQGRVNVDALWQDIGPIIDALEEGIYCHEH